MYQVPFDVEIFVFFIMNITYSVLISRIDFGGDKSKCMLVKCRNRNINMYFKASNFAVQIIHVDRYPHSLFSLCLLHI